MQEQHQYSADWYMFPSPRVKLASVLACTLQDPLAVIGILGIFFPFILLAVAIAAGYIDLSVYR